MPRPLFVTRPILPDLQDVQTLLHGIWNRRVLTNGGPLHDELERRLSEHLEVPAVSLFTNGTIALLAALRVLDLPEGSEVITTPLTFAATAHAVAWNGLNPVFADVTPETLTIDPNAVESAISPKTSAILAVHVYGTICDHDRLQAVASRHRLPLLYDAAHAFGSRMDGNSCAALGDMSVYSLHATKLYNTFEGGVVTTTRSELTEKLKFVRNFGIKSEEEVVSIGINGKMNEFQAAIGLLNLERISDEKARRRSLRRRYLEALAAVPGVRLPYQQENVDNSEQ